ncbi:MAG: FCD domain-containing protein [Gammaproteobacteria bacterium]|nr:FCD domain-containing protein [Gammaproteobacteria bacterium]MCY4218986.1 FCD domain-containing protein [Gammaproteobacteria bacterium]MCY4274883.1 FCD domain-containing protein [Gammaproteobacteria bacterium]
MNTEYPRSKVGASGIFNSIRDHIVNGYYSFNEKLPPERTLATNYGVARGTVRAALDQLQSANMVRKKFGSGTYVNYASSFNQIDIPKETSPLELIETRMAVETHIVRLVISNATTRDLGTLENALRTVQKYRQNPDRFSMADEAFHMTLAECSKNPLIIWIYQRINDIRSHEQWAEHKSGILTPRKIARYNEQHSKLVRLIARRDMDRAITQMVQHLHQAKKDILESLAESENYSNDPVKSNGVSVPNHPTGSHSRFQDA